MGTLFEDYTRARTKAVNNWQRNFVASYGSAYSTAVANYRKTLDLQEKADQERKAFWAGLAMFALTLCGGSALTMVFGNAAAKAAAGQIALDVICRNNMERTFRLAHFASTNKTADFVLGALWDKGADAMSEQLKSSLAENASNYSTIGKLGEDPQSLQNHLWQWVLDAENKVLLAEEDYSKNIKDETEKTNKIQGLINSPFMRSAPTTRPDETTLSGDIEWTFYMNMILDSDYIGSGYYDERPRGGWVKRQTGRTPITTSPSSDKYPKPYTSKGTFGGVDFEETKYTQYGSIIRKRINELHEQRFHTKLVGSDKEVGLQFFSKAGVVDRDMLIIAERRLNDMGSTNLTKIQQTLAG